MAWYKTSKTRSHWWKGVQTYHLFGARMHVWYAFFHLGTLRTHLALFNNLPSHFTVYCKPSKLESGNGLRMKLILWYLWLSMSLVILSHLSLHDWSTADDIRYTDRLVFRPDQNKASTVQIHNVKYKYTCLKVAGDKHCTAACIYTCLLVLCGYHVHAAANLIVV